MTSHLKGHQGINRKGLKKIKPDTKVRDSVKVVMVEGSVLEDG